MICCCNTQSILVIVGFQRKNFGGSIGNASFAALDGATGSVLWYYDLGITSAGSTALPYIPGRPLIDSSGNIYLPIFGLTAASGLGGKFSSSRLLKFDKTGALLWTYDPGDSTADCQQGASIGFANFQVAGACFDSSGNIVWGRFCSDTTNYNYAYKVDTSGSLVTTYSTHGTGFGGLADATLITGSNTGPVARIALDASDNVYWVAPNDRNRIVKVNSSGAFQSATGLGLGNYAGVAGTDQTAGIANSLVCDTTNSKLFIGIASSIVSA